MPTYDGIGETITHKLEIEGDMFLQDIEGGTNSTQVPLEIFSDFTSSNDESINSRMLRLRVNNLNAIQDDNSNIYVTDMGIKGQVDKDYFFITAPQNTSNVGDQNTFVISTTSNVGIGTTSPSYNLHVAGDIYATGNIIGYSDERAKSDIQKIESALEKIEKLNGYTFTMNNKRYTGMIAQEVLQVLPEAVVGTEETEYALAYGNMMGLIIEGIKEIKMKLDMLNTQRSA